MTESVVQNIFQMEMNPRKSMTCNTSPVVTLLMYLGFCSKLFPLASVLKVFKNRAAFFEEGDWLTTVYQVECYFGCH